MTVIRRTLILHAGSYQTVARLERSSHSNMEIQPRLTCFKSIRKHSPSFLRPSPPPSGIRQSQPHSKGKGLLCTTSRLAIREQRGGDLSTGGVPEVSFCREPRLRLRPRLDASSSLRERLINCCLNNHNTVICGSTTLKHKATEAKAKRIDDPSSLLTPQSVLFYDRRTRSKTEYDAL